jgi:hypothetical protein
MTKEPSRLDKDNINALVTAVLSHQPLVHTSVIDESESLASFLSAAVIDYSPTIIGPAKFRFRGTLDDTKGITYELTLGALVDSKANRYDGAVSPQLSEPRINQKKFFDSVLENLDSDAVSYMRNPRYSKCKYSLIGKLSYKSEGHRIITPELFVGGAPHTSTVGNWEARLTKKTPTAKRIIHNLTHIASY